MDMKSSKVVDSGVFALIPIDQILFDPNQPRLKWTKKGIERLGASIKAQGLQQPVIVNFAYRKKGKDYYYIKAGERRYRAHLYLEEKVVPCIIRNEKYNGEVDVARILQQATENSLREPHTHSEIIRVVRMVVEEEREASGGERGYIGLALEKVSVAFGKSYEWAKNYHVLGNLIPELAEMLDIHEENEDTEEGEKLNFNVALVLARGPQDTQRKTFEDSKKHFEKSFSHGLQFISQTTRSIRNERGENVRGKRPDEKFQSVEKLLRRMHSGYDRLLGGMKPKEIRELLSTRGVIDIDSLLVVIRTVTRDLGTLLNLVQERRDQNYDEMRVGKK